jgi:AcrR family transcriptional regulator
MTKPAQTGRWQQRRRTRKDLLHAAASLLKQGRTPTLEDIADEAQVSRATAYRYFPNVEALLSEAPLDSAVPEPAELFSDKSDGAQGDPVARLEKVDDVLERAVLSNEAAMRVMLANSVRQRLRANGGAALPVRQDRRSPLIDAALAPARTRFKSTDLAKLKAALALIVGTEALIVFRDVLQLDDAEAHKVKRWAIRALVQAALK